MTSGDWVLVDAGDIIVHIFRPEVRAYYDLEGMWSVKEPARARAH
jgi:ribosome-associated protein